MTKKKIDPLNKKIPFNKSVKRSVILAFEQTCAKLGLKSSLVTENLLIEFIHDNNEVEIKIKEPKIKD